MALSFPSVLPLIAPRRALVLLPVAVFLMACGGETAIDLVLVADPNVNDSAALVRQLQSLKLVISSPSGLYGTPPSSTGPDFKLVDVDGDGKRELIAERPVPPLDHLPRIRLERGGLQLIPLELRFDGGSPCKPDNNSCPSGTDYFAAGGVKGVRMTDGTVQQTEVPFNIRLLYRQPQVTQVNPENGAINPPRSFDSVVVIFSKKMSSSVQELGVVKVVRVEGSSEVDVPAAQPVTLTNLGGLESPAVAEYRFKEGLDVGSYRIRVSTGARDASGRYLDQIPMQPGDQPFTSSFTVGGTGTLPQMPACNPCPAWCSQGGELCAAGLKCDLTTHTCKPQTCPAQCPYASVCDPALGVCVTDCRVHGSYGGCPPAQSCLPTGLCGSSAN